MPNDIKTNAKLGNLARTLAAILGARWDAAGDLGTDIAALLAGGIAVSGTVVDGAPTVIDFDTSLSEATNNHYNGGLLLFTTGPNAGQGHLVDVYTGGANGNVAFAINDRWTDVPVNGNSFILIPNAGAYLKKIFTSASTIDTVQGAMADAATLDDLSDVTTTSTEAKLRRLLLRMSGAGIFSADIQGAARTELDTMLAQLAVYFNLAGAALGVTMNPGAGARANLQLILQDLADMLAGGTGIVTWPTPRQLPANGVSLAEVERYIAEVKPEWAARTSATYTTITATEETILTTAYAVPGLFYFNLTLRNMVAQDDFTIRVYKRVDGANYDLKSEQNFVDAPTVKVYEIEGLYSDGTEFIRITIQRNSATNRAFPYSLNFLRQPV